MRYSGFQSITFRVSLTIIVVIIIAEIISATIWFNTTNEKRKQNAVDIVSSITNAAYDTYHYFQALPVNYRHLVLSQLREVGGTRFFISINNKMIPQKEESEYNYIPRLTDITHRTLSDNIGSDTKIHVSILKRENIRIFNSAIKLDELPDIWTKYSLVLGELDLPIIVIQIEIHDNQWFYLATVIPIPFSSLQSQYVETRQLLFLVVTALLLMLCTYWILQREIRPIKALAKAATLTGGHLSAVEIKEEGSRETKSAIHAFNKMNRRVKAFIRDRELLFSSISHDLKTPLACLKLRTEMLDDEPTKVRFEKLLNEVDLMLSGALLCIRGTDIHEEPEWINITNMIKQCANYHNQNISCVTVNMPKHVHYFGKPIAIKRCIYNLIDNAVRYGLRAEIHCEITETTIVIFIRDFGPGIDERQLEKVFDPYCRGSRTDQSGSGLGLTISRSIARRHGGDLVIVNHPEQGLEANLVLVSEL